MINKVISAESAGVRGSEIDDVIWNETIYALQDWPILGTPESDSARMRLAQNRVVRRFEIPQEKYLKVVLYIHTVVRLNILEIYREEKTYF